MQRCDQCRTTPWIQPGYVLLNAGTVGRCACNPPRPEPEGKVYTQETWAETIEAMHRGNKVEIDAEVYDYFLECLPPRWMNRTRLTMDGNLQRFHFGFCEGADIIVGFWTVDGCGPDRYFCQYTNQLSRGE